MKTLALIGAEKYVTEFFIGEKEKWTNQRTTGPVLPTWVLRIRLKKKKFKQSPWAGADNQLGPKFWCQQEDLITMVICCKFKKNLFNLWLYTHLFMISNMYITAGQGQSIPGHKILMSAERSSHFGHLVQVLKKISLKSNFIQFFSWFYTCIKPRGRGWQPLGDEILISTGTSCHFGHLLQVSKKSLWSLIFSSPEQSSRRVIVLLLTLALALASASTNVKVLH